MSNEPFSSFSLLSRCRPEQQLKRIGVVDAMAPRKLKDGNAPKKNLTAYMIWSNDVRNKVREANPEAKMTDLAKIMGEQWKTVSDEEKARYQQLALAERARYDAEITAYKNTDSFRAFQQLRASMKDQPKKGKKNKDKDPNAPKKAVGAYMHFCKEQRPLLAEKNPEASFVDLGRLLGVEWQKYTPEQRKKYDDLAARDKQRYEQESNAYRQQLLQHPEQAMPAQPHHQQHHHHHLHYQQQPVHQQPQPHLQHHHHLHQQHHHLQQQPQQQLQQTQQHYHAAAHPASPNDLDEDEEEDEDDE